MNTMTNITEIFEQAYELGYKAGRNDYQLEVLSKMYSDTTQNTLVECEIHGIQQDVPYVHTPTCPECHLTSCGG